MQKAHCCNRDEEWETFVSVLLSASVRNRVQFMAPDLGQDFVARHGGMCATGEDAPGPLPDERGSVSYSETATSLDNMEGPAKPIAK